MKNNSTTMFLASIGALGGLYYAFKKGKGFWGYAGFFVLGSIAGHLAGNIVTAVIPQKKSDGKSLPPDNATNPKDYKGDAVIPSQAGVDINNDPVMIKPKS